VIRIGMTGAHGTGKTSMAEAMMRHPAFEGFFLVPSSARQIKEYGYPINREASELSQTLVPILRMLDEHEAAIKNQVNGLGMISDRTPLDSLAYTYYQNEYVWNHGDFIENVARRLSDMYMPSYHYVLYFPIYWTKMADDGVRDPDEVYRDMIDRYVLAALEILDRPFLTVPNVSPEERVEWFVDHVAAEYRELERQYGESFRNML
jgi:hypothetical protein